MAKGRSSFTFYVKEPDKAQALINEWLSVYQFSSVELKGEQCYRRGDAWAGFVYFNYQIQGNRVQLWAWKRALAGEVGIYTLDIFTSYRDIVNQLLEQLTLISTNDSATSVEASLQTKGNATMQSNQFQPNNTGNNFRNISSKTDENLCVVGFVMALLNCLLVLLDGSIALGGLGYILIFAFSARGLKTKKRNLAIAAIVLGIVSLVVFVMKIVDLMK